MSVARAILLAALTLASLAAGFLSPALAPAIALAAGAVVGRLFSVYEVFAPAILFLALSGSLASIFSQEGGLAHSARLYLFILGRKALATLFGVVFTAVVLGLPLARAHTDTVTSGLDPLLRTLRTAFFNPFTWAAVLAILAGLLLRNVRVRGKGLHDLEEAIEKLGGGLQLLAPLFLFAFGAYLRGLPDRLPPEVSHAGAPRVPIIFGLCALSIGTPREAFRSYLIASGLVLAGSGLWHLGLVLLARLRVPGFRVREYFFGYFVRVYPFLFATASESLSMPLNLAMTRRIYGRLWGASARFMVTAGSTLDVNGTVICACIFSGLCARLSGADASVLDLVMTAPAIFIVSLAVPGIPGELALFVDPVAVGMGIPAATIASFRTLFLGFQVGLPDSTRTGINSTDNCVFAFLFGRAERDEARANAMAAPPVS